MKHLESALPVAVNVLFLVDLSNLQVGFMPLVPHPPLSTGRHWNILIISNLLLPRRDWHLCRYQGIQGFDQGSVYQWLETNFSQSHLHFFLQKRAAKAMNSFPSCSCAGAKPRWGFLIDPFKKNRGSTVEYKHKNINFICMKKKIETSNAILHQLFGLFVEMWPQVFL